MSSSGRATGTVPKIKGQGRPNTREQQEQRRTVVVPNNLQASTLEWQPSSTQHPSTRARKTRNTRQPLQDYFDENFELQSSHERLRPQLSDSSLRSAQSDLHMENERDKMRRSVSETTQSVCNPHPRSQEQPYNTLLDTKNNISRIPDRNQVLSRLNQIRDYVKQTSALMDSLRGSSDPNHIIQVVKLRNMNADLRNSEGRLVQLLNTLNSLSEGPELVDNYSTPEHLERFSQLLDIVKIQEDTCLGLFKDGGVLPDTLMSPQSPPNGFNTSSQMVTPENLSVSQSSSRSVSEEPGSSPTAAQYAKHQELKLKVEESQKKLQALQEHQAALVTLQHKAQQQLREAQAQQGALLATAVEESQTSDSGNLDNLNTRMQTLTDLIHKRNEVAHLLDEQDEELEVEHSVIEERLQELHGRKQAMDRLVHELKSLGETDLAAIVNRSEPLAHQNGVGENHAESSEEEDTEEVAVVSDKLEELNRMKAQLAQLQSMVAAVSSGELPHETVKAALAETRSRSEERNFEVRGQRSQRNSECSSKPDNIILSSEGTSSYLEAQLKDIKTKSDQLNKAKKRLQQLKDLLGSVGITDDLDDEDEHVESSVSSQQPTMSVEAAHALSREIHFQTQNIRSEQERLTALHQSAIKLPVTSAPLQVPHQAKNKNQVQRTSEPKRDGASSRQLALQAELQAKRQELEELMHKDQGQSSSLNQDTCSETGFSLPETSATWGGSSSSQTALLATVEQEADAQEQSMVCSSDDALDEPLVDNRTPVPQQISNSRQRQQSLPPLPPNAAGSYQPPWYPFRQKGDSSRKDSPDASRVSAPWMRPGVSPAGGHDTMGPQFELPRSLSSSGATPRPPSESGSTNTQSQSWWPMHVQQQLETTSAMCQAMMQQWQWGSPGHEPWWNMQGPIPPAALHQQQLVLSLNQCCHMLWMQHRELAALHATVQNLQERIAYAERFGLVAAASGVTENNQSPQPSPHQPLKVSLSTGVFPSTTNDQGAAVAGTPSAASGVSSAHSLPNLCDGPPSLPQPSSSSYVLPPHPTVAQYPWMTSMHPARSSTATVTPNNPGMPSLLRHGPPVTLNNQVPPGIRANNYYDNFRSYSRQNVLSASTKSNEGHLHNPSPIADRSHNSLRGAEPQQAVASSSVNTTQPVRSRKQKLNTEQRQPLSSVNTSTSPARHIPQTRQPMSSPGSSHHRGLSSSSALLQESLYTELAALVAQNQSRPEFLPQLFRELQSLSCDNLCQQALQSIREISHTARVESRVRNSDQTANQLRPKSRESLGSATGEKDDVLLSTSGHSITNSDINMTQPLLEEASNSNETSPDSVEGATALPFSVTSISRASHRLVPAMETCSMDLQAGPSSSHGQFDVEIQSLLLQLLPFLKAHREECCSPALLEAVRQHTLSLVPPPVTGINGFIQGQLDALLEDALLKFQGCWLRDVREEVLATIAEVLLNELTFFKLLDTVTRPVPQSTGHSRSPDSSSALHSEHQCQSSTQLNSLPPEELLETHNEDLGATGPVSTQSPHNCWLPSRIRDTTLVGWDTRKETATALSEAESMLGCNGDLAEADQSHEDGRLSEIAGGVSTSTSNSLGDGAASGRNSQAEGITAGDHSSSDVAEDEMDNMEELGTPLTDNQIPTEVSQDEGWNVEQDRDLDQVPTRLEPGGSSGSSSQQQADTSTGSPRP